MFRNTLARALGALLAIAAVPAFAQSLPASDFAKQREISDVALSPNGEYLALAVPTADGSETQLRIMRLDGTGSVQSLRFGKQNHVDGLAWTADDQVTVARATKEPLEEFLRSRGELMSTDISGKRQETLFAYVEDDGMKRGRRKDEGWAFMQRIVDKEPGKALVSFTCWNCGAQPDAVIYKVDTITGNRQEIERIKTPRDHDGPFVFDQDGIARYAYSVTAQDTPRLLYRPTQTSPWTPMPESLVGYEITGGVIASDNNTFHALLSDEGEPNQLYKIDLKAGTRTKVIGRDDVEVSALLIGGRNGTPFGVLFDASKPSIQYIDTTSEWAKLHAGLMKSFPGQLVVFDDFTRDNTKVLFRTFSDRQPANYYVLDRATNKVTLVAESAPWIKAAQLAPTRAIEFKTRDGETLFGFYTANGTGPKPTIVIPHGGPFEVYDRWAYDPEVQFLASRGYGVLQINFRGSGGRGHDFESSAWRQWGGRIQEDITDGVKYAIDAKLADPDRICMYGASFGAYSAMMQPILNPGMYKCAVGYVGAYDLPLLRKDKDMRMAARGERWFDRTLGTDMAALAKESPSNRAGDIKVPVMLVHGKSDSNTGIGQFRSMETALRNAGNPAEVFLANGEGHGFVNPSNITELYTRLETFFAKHLGADAAPAAK